MRSNSKSLDVIATFTRLSHNRATLNSPRPAILPTPESRDESCCGGLVVFAAGVFVADAPTVATARQEALARHLAASGAIFYGAYW